MKRFLLGLLLLAALTQQLSAGEKGWFGFGVAVELEGFILNPTLKAVKLDTVEPKSPAAEKGLAVGDEVLQVEGTDVPGSKALKLKALMQKEIGQTLRMKLKRPNGESYSVTLTAAKSPK
jgi:C-terminal processing protease CtpA/Prc